MIKTKKQGLFIVISGPSGAGKGTVIQNLIKDNPNVWLSVSATTRAIRKDDIKDVTYFFLTKEEFEERIKNNEFLEYEIVHNGQYYGTPNGKINEYLNNGIDVILEIDIKGALKVKNVFPQGLYIFILPPSMRELKKRLVERNTESNDKIIERFKTAYKEINEVTKYNYVVVNDDIDTAVNKVSAIMMAERCRVDRIEEVYLNTLEEELHEDLADIN